MQLVIQPPIEGPPCRDRGRLFAPHNTKSGKLGHASASLSLIDRSTSFFPISLKLPNFPIWYSRGDDLHFERAIPMQWNQYRVLVAAPKP